MTGLPHPVVLAAVLVAGGLAGAVVLVALPRRSASGVARSLDLVRAAAVMADGGATASSGSAASGGSAASPASVRDRVVEPLLEHLARLGARLTPVGTPQRLRRRLDLAGNTPPWDLRTVPVLKAVGTVLLGGLGLVLWSAAGTGTGLLLFVLLTALGYWAGDLLLYDAGVKRQEAIRRSVPDALDMLTVCVEAGLGFDAALGQVASKTTGPLADEFARVLTEVQLGRARREAFGDLAARTDVPEVTAFVGALVQADRLGVPLGGVLREQAHELRLRRRQWAEEKAQKVPVKIVFPVMFCIFPVFFVIVIGPGVIRIAEVFSHG